MTNAPSRSGQSTLGEISQEHSEHQEEVRKRKDEEEEEEGEEGEQQGGGATALKNTEEHKTAQTNANLVWAGHGPTLEKFWPVVSLVHFTKISVVKNAGLG